MNEYPYSMSANPNPRTILRIDDVLHRTGLKRTMLYDLVRKERFPRQVSLGARAVGWYEEQVDEWIKDRTAAGNDDLCGELGLVSETQPTVSVSSRLPGVEDVKTALRPSVRPRKKAPQLVESCSAGGANSGCANGDRIATRSGQAIVGAEELMRLRDENGRLRRIVADLILKNDILQSPFAQ